MIRLVLAIALALTVSAEAQTYSIPKKISLEGAARREFREWWTTAARYPGLVPEQFFPIGWSRDGKFAYYTEPVDEACGCYYARLVIQDMRTDKVLYEFKYNQDDTTNDKGDMTGPGDIRALWAKNRKLFSEKLAENRIVASRFVMLGKTFRIGGRSYAAKSAIKMGKNPEEDWDRVNKFDIMLAAPKLGAKNVYSADYTKEEYWFMLDAGVIGVIKSPFEDRVAIVAMEVMRGWEGPPHTGDVRVVGADLTSGFRKIK
jgi:hypothetical protein